MWDISASFRKAIESPVHTMIVRAQVLDTDFRVVPGGEFYDTGSQKYIQNYIVDGSVDVDTGRATRRTLNLSLLNPHAQFSPDSQWGGLFYVDRLIRVWRGVRTDNEELYVPIGTFMIDTADVVAERNMSIVPITGSDQWKRLSKAKLGAPKKYTKLTPVQDVIKDLAGRGGVTKFNIDPLNARDSQTRLIQADLNYERAAVIGDEIQKLGTAWGVDVYFDPMGYFVSEEKRPNRTAVWSYAPGEDSSLLVVKASYKDEQVYNHILVTGTADENNPVYANAFDTDPSSPTNVNRIGRRTYMYESKFIATVQQAQDVANKYLMEHTTVSEDIELQTICNPAYEGNDAINVREDDFTKVNKRYRIRSFTIPLSSSRQQIRLNRLIKV